MDEILGNLDTPVTQDTATDLQLTSAGEEARQKCLACAFILGSDRSQHGKLIKDLENSHTQKQDKHLSALTDAHNLLVQWKQDPRNLM